MQAFGRTLGFAAVVGLISSQPAAAEVCYMQQPQSSYANESGLSIARVYQDENAQVPRGAATLIDRKLKLFVTADHVATSDSAFVTFPHISSRTIEAQVIFRIPQIASDSGNTSVVTEPQDLAILVAKDDLPSSAVAADLNPYMYPGLRLTYYGFPNPTAGPVAGTGIASSFSAGQPDSCLWILREPSDAGDSGSGMISPDGYLHGVTIQKTLLNPGASSVALTPSVPKFVPASCFFDEFVAKLDEYYDDTLSREILDQNALALSALLGSPSNKQRHSNLEFYVAVRRIVRGVANGEIQASDVFSKINCPIVPLLTQRRLPLPPGALGISSPRALADSTFKKAQSTSDQDEKFVLLTAAVELYRRELGGALSDFSSENNVDYLSIPNKFDATDAYVFKSLADAEYALAEVSGDRRLLGSATRNSIAAISISEANRLDGLRSSAFATLGLSTKYSDDIELSLQAFMEARAGGARSGWIRQNIQQLADWNRRAGNLDSSTTLDRVSAEALKSVVEDSYQF